MTLEAVAGKNPVSHVGKLYNVLAQEVAADLVRSVPGVTAAVVRLVSCIGRPIDQPQVVHVELFLGEGDLGAVQARVDELVRSHLSKIASLTERFVRGELRVY
jgi:S-adenosylmethionine synthetase